MYKILVLFFLTFIIFSCMPKQVSQNVVSKDEEVLVEEEKSFSELFSGMDEKIDDPTLTIWFINEDNLGRGFYNIGKDGTINYGIGLDYLRLALIQEIYTDDTITLYFSYLRSDGTQIDNPPFYRVVVTKDEVRQTINDVNYGKKKYYVIDKVREELGEELPDELEGIELPW